jgi:ribonuclease BN (tRNA processing enzyme)
MRPTGQTKILQQAGGPVTCGIGQGAIVRVMRNRLRQSSGRIALRLVMTAVLGGLAARSVRVVDASKAQRPASPTGTATVSAPAPKTRAIDPILEAGSPDGKWAVYRKTHPAKEIWLRNLETGQDRKLVELPNYSWELAWSLDGRQLAVGVETDSTHAIYLVDMPAGTSRRLPTEEFAGFGPWILGWTNAGEILLRRNVRQPDGSVVWAWELASTRSAEHREVYRTSASDQTRVVGNTPDGRRLVVVAQQRLLLRDLATGADQELVNGNNPVLSPDGTRMAWRSGTGVYAGTIDSSGVRNAVRIAEVPAYVNDIAMWWMTDGSLALTHGSYDTSELYRLDLDQSSHTARGLPRKLLSNADWVAIAPDSKHIAHTYYRGVNGLGVVDASTGDDKTLLADEPKLGWVFGWRSPSVVLITNDKRVLSFDLNTHASATLLTDAKVANFSSYSPVRDEILAIAGRQGTQTVSIRRFDGAERDVMRVDRLVGLVLSPDGTQIAYGRRTGEGPEAVAELRLVNTDGSNDRLVTSVSGKKSVDPLAWSPRGEFILYEDDFQPYEQRLRILDVATRKNWLLAPSLDPAFSNINSAGWAPDGSFLAIDVDTDEARFPIGLIWSGGEGLPPAPQVSRTKVILLGTGTPNADPERFGPAVAIVVDDQSYLVDAGVGVVRRAAATKDAALTPPNLKRVFLTHLHSDHTLGLPDLMLSPWVLGRPTPLDVYGPRGTASMTTNILEAWREDIAIRTYGLEPKHAGPRAYEAVPHEISAGRVYEDDKVKVDAIAVTHGTWPQAFGYRFQTADRVIVISGDTSPATTIAEACRGCDVLVHEVYSSAANGTADRKAYDSAYHTSTKELAAIASSAQPKILVLYHQLFRGASGEDLEREIAAAGYKGRVVSGKDLDVY